MLFQTQEKNVLNWTRDWSKLQNNLITHSLDQIDSTNTFAKHLPISPHPQLVVSGLQTQGRGRGEHTWISAQKNMCFYSSWVFDVNYHVQPLLSPLVGLSIYEALLEIRGFENVSLKAPNDIYMKEKKVGGILIENQNQGTHTRCIIGIGINVLDKPDLPTAGCLQEFRSENIDFCVWSAFLIELFQRLQTSLMEAQKEELSLSKRQLLLKALNENKQSQYRDVLADGSLISSHNQKTHWSDL